jgi:hypothetical protein
MPIHKESGQNTTFRVVTTRWQKSSNRRFGWS